MADITIAVTYFAFLLGLGVLVANVLKKYNIPDTFFLLMLGLLLGPTVFSNPAVTQYINITLVDVNQMGNIPDFLRTLALILVVFTGTFNLSIKTFKRFSDVSLNMALTGVVFNTVFLGFFASFLFGLDMTFSLLLGAVLGGTGSGAVFAFEKALFRNRKALTILKVESILNSPLTILFPMLFLDLLALQPGSLFEPLKYANQFWLMIVAGVGTGLITGYGSAKILGKTLREYTVLLFLSIALITFAMAEVVGGSGILAVAVCGLITGNMTFRHREDVREFDDYFYEMLRISVFTLLGAQVYLMMSFQAFLLAFLFFLLMFFSRPLFVIASLGKERYKMSRKDLLLMGFIAPRGIAAAAMAPIVTSAMLALGKPEAAGLVINMIFLMILFSVLFSTVVGKILSSPRVMNEESRGEQRKTRPEQNRNLRPAERISMEDSHMPELPEESAARRKAES